MNRHYSLAIFAMSCFFSWELFSSQACQSALNVADWLMGTLGLLGIVVLAWQAIGRHPGHKSGDVVFTRIDSLPTNINEADNMEDFEGQILRISPGVQKLIFHVRSAHGFQVKKINWRCLDYTITTSRPIKWKLEWLKILITLLYSRILTMRTTERWLLFRWTRTGP